MVFRGMLVVMHMSEAILLRELPMFAVHVGVLPEAGGEAG